MFGEFVFPLWEQPVLILIYLPTGILMFFYFDFYGYCHEVVCEIKQMFFAKSGVYSHGWNLRTNWSGWVRLGSDCGGLSAASSGFWEKGTPSVYAN